MHSDLAILSAEQYDLGGRFSSSRSRKSQAPSLSEDGPAPRKKAKVQVTVTEKPDKDDDEKKRARGRPRLDTKDETAADRRRTQIRLAQRAYRNRKENAISTLEKKVSDLKETNEEMSQAFMKLHDFAISQGLLDGAPEFGRQLRATTEKFLALARRSSDDSSKDDDLDGTADPESEEQAASEEPPKRRKRLDTQKSASPENGVSSSSPQTSNVASQPLYAGVVVTHNPEPVTTSGLIEPSLSSAFSMSQPPQGLGYEVITLPTLENASFPFDLDVDTSFNDIFSTPPQAPQLSPFLSLPLPDTHAYGESTFGRRLQRVALERGLQLITMQDPPKEHFARVFGFCILFEPIDKIKARLRAGVDKAKSESLHYWQHPFLSLGGAGSHFPGFSSNTTPPLRNSPFDTSQDSCSPRRIGNQGTSEELKHANSASGFGVGPYSEDIVEARSNRLDSTMRMNLPGFMGDFYDADEVELSLMQRGVLISASQDFITAEVDVNAFSDTEGLSLEDQSEPIGVFGSPGAGVQPTATGGFQSISPGHAYTDLSSDGGSGIASGDASPGHSSGGTTGLTLPDTGNSTWSMDGMISSTSAEDPMASIFAATTSGNFGGNSILAFAGISPSRDTRQKKVVTMDVNVFIRELTERATCLGRTPGFRPKDVNAAFWIATRYS